MTKLPLRQERRQQKEDRRERNKAHDDFPKDLKFFAFHMKLFFAFQDFDESIRRDLDGAFAH